MKYQNLRMTFRFWAWGLAAILGPSVVAVAVNQVLDDGQWSRPWTIGAVVLTLAAAGAVRQQAKYAPQPMGTLAETKERLAGLVDTFWHQELSRRSLGDPPIPVSWQVTRRARFMDHPHLIADGELSFTGRSDQIAALAGEFRRLRRRRLVITGGPGTGKTTLAVQLLLELTKTRTDDEPVPVLLSVADWNTETHPRLAGWVAERLRTDYLAMRGKRGPDTAETLASGGHILAILDGLDELPPAARAGVIAALSETLTDRDQVIVTSRTTEYGGALQEARRALKAAAVIVPRELTPRDAHRYLSDCLGPRPSPAWVAVLEMLESGRAPALAAVTSTALGLWLLRATYLDRAQDPTALVTTYTDAASLQTHLLDGLVPALLQAHQRTIRPERVRRWLVTLSGEGSPDLAWWELTTRGRLWVVKSCAALLYGLPVGLAAGLGDGPVLGVTAGLVFGFACQSSALNALDFTQLPVARRITATISQHGHWLLLILLGPPTFIVLGLSTTVGFKAALASGLVLALGMWMAIVMNDRMPSAKRKPAPTDTLLPFTAALTPLTSWKVNRSLLGLRLVNGLLVGAVIALTGDYITSYLGPSQTEFWRDLGWGLFSGAVLGAVQQTRQAWLLATIGLLPTALSGRLPLRLMRFLGDMHRLGVLRAVGPFYQFRHAVLRDHLTTTTETPVPSVTT